MRKLWELEIPPGISSVYGSSVWQAVGFEGQVSQAIEQRGPSLATKDGNRTQGKEVLCSSHLDTNP